MNVYRFLGVIASYTLCTGVQAVAPPLSNGTSQTQFETSCINEHESCLYSKRTFLSRLRLDSVSVRYVAITSQAALHKYNHDAQLWPVKGLPGTNIESADSYDRRLHTWTPILPSRDCRYCVHPASSDESFFPITIRISIVSSQIVSDAGYASFGDIVGGSDDSAVDLVITAAHNVDVYADVHQHGNTKHLSTTSSPGRTFHIDLDSKDGTSRDPAYYVVSPLKSWRAVASIYRDREAALLTESNQLPLFHSMDSQEKVARIVRYISGYRWGYLQNIDQAFPTESVDSLLAKKRSDCRGLVTLFQAALLKSGILSQPVLLNYFGTKPLSWGVPSPWPNHVILYIPALGKYVDITQVITGESTWEKSATRYRGYVALNIGTGIFNVIR